MIENGSTFLLAAVMPGHGTHPLVSLAVSVLFAAIFILGGRWPHELGQRSHRRFLSFAGGIAVAYVFVHVLPAHGIIWEFQAEAPTGFARVFPEYSVYLWSMAGFLAYYGLEFLVDRTPRGTPHGPASEKDASPWRPWVHIDGFGLYAWLITFLMVWTGKGPLALCLFSVAMAMHLFPIAHSLRSHHQAVYERRGAPLLAAACLGGWICGQTLIIPRPIVFNFVAIVAGGVIVNAAISELPKEKEGSYWAFLTGAVAYTAFLLTVSHFEHGG